MAVGGKGGSNLGPNSFYPAPTWQQIWQPNNATLPPNYGQNDQPPAFAGLPVGTRILDVTAIPQVFPQGWAETRASKATFFNSAGLLRTEDNNGVRVDYVFNGTASVLGGVFVEPAGTNNLLQSNVFNIAPWVNSNSCTVTPNATVSPDGSANAWSVINTSSVSIAGLSQNTSLSFSAGVPTPHSVYVKPFGGFQWVIVDIWDGNNYSVWLDLANGTVGSTTSFGGVTTTGFIEALPNGWFRCTNITTKAAGANPCFPGVYLANADGVYTWTGSPTKGLYIYGDQLEQAAGLTRPTSYISTGAATVTRAADSISFTLRAGVTALTFTFDDLSTQTVSGLTGGATYTIPTNLNRARILFIDDSTGSVGSASGAGDATGIGASVAACPGSAAGSSTASGVGQSVIATVGTAAGSSSVSAVGQTTKASVGSAAGSSSATAASASTATAVGASTATGVGASRATSVGTASGSSTVSAVGASTATGVGTATGSATASAVGTATIAAIGTAAGTATANAATQGTQPAVGTAGGASSATAVGRSTATSTGTAAGTATAAATGASTATAIGSAAASSTATGVGATASFAGVGTAAGSATTTGAGTALIPAAGTAAGASTVAAITLVTKPSVGTAAGSATVTAGSASTGAATGSSTATAVGTAARLTTGTAAGSSTATAAGEKITAGVGTAAGGGTATGTGRLTAAATGTAAGTATAQATSGAIQSAVGIAAGASVVVGVGKTKLLRTPHSGVKGSIAHNVTINGSLRRGQRKAA
jgi:hypothetical protein